jgi:hypothetical protein
VDLAVHEPINTRQNALSNIKRIEKDVKKISKQEVQELLKNFVANFEKKREIGRNYHCV